MSFSYEVKTELCRADIGSKTMAAAQAYGVLLFANTFTAREIRIVTGNADLASHFPRLFKRSFGLDFDSVSGDGERKKKIFSI
ncbi:MAG: DNA-binding protein WhiA, partial [Oscillospiraceae bacterium]|nr:DNA-binding protein WhiA [Oscillospiraceae bacterium]